MGVDEKDLLDDIALVSAELARVDARAAELRRTLDALRSELAAAHELDGLRKTVARHATLPVAQLNALHAEWRGAMLQRFPRRVAK